MGTHRAERPDAGRPTRRAAVVGVLTMALVFGTVLATALTAHRHRHHDTPRPTGPASPSAGPVQLPVLPRAMAPAGAAPSRLAREAARQRRLARERMRPTTFMVSTFNLLGYSHTAKGGNKVHRRWPNGHLRAEWAAALLRRFSVSVAGLQEFQIPQYNTFMRVAGGEYAVYPGAAGGRAAVQNSIVWRRSEWRLLEAHTLPVRYFHGHVVPMPYVELKNLRTGQKVWFANYHNPADVHGPAARWRAIDARMEGALFKRLLGTGAPVIVTGDMNDRATYFCQVSAVLPGLHGANGSARVGGSCRVPRHIGIDWIIGTKAVSFSGFSSFRDARVRRTSDHPIVLAKAAIAPTAR